MKMHAFFAHAAAERRQWSTKRLKGERRVLEERARMHDGAVFAALLARENILLDSYRFTRRFITKKDYSLVVSFFLFEQAKTTSQRAEVRMISQFFLLLLCSVVHS